MSPVVNSDDPMAAVRAYVDAFNKGDATAMAAVCADPMQILDGMSPHVWQGPTAAEDWYADALAEGNTSGSPITTSDWASRSMSMSPATTPMWSLPPRSITTVRANRLTKPTRSSHPDRPVRGGSGAQLGRPSL
jgi:hypothetical protein